ncbi:unnamed protein product [Phaedon cochleariae]|uniref:Helicase ATP-binding domain-containing protein n=1 Tax=Phaedon cochleariae TaxID=80249 RepID=A0A9P0DS09_PHACE|nr:unnamed protein product [Phaedon cochleariae]
MNTLEEIIKGSLKIPDKFDFPFPPYGIQNEFMKNLYSVLENGKLGIFESPTGTGKSLSIICGAIRWLKDHEEFKRLSISNNITKLEQEKLEVADDEKDWIVAQYKERELTEKLNFLKIQESKIQDYEKKLKNLEKVKEYKLTKKWKNLNKNHNNQHELLKDDSIEKNVDEDEDILPEEPELSATDDYVSDEDEKETSYEPSKIYICSRTHSQLAQFVGEIIKSPFANDVRVASLASRQAYCINPEVSKLKSMALINERCVDLQKKLPKAKVDQDGKVVKKQKGTSCSCPYYKQTAIEELGNFALVQVQDVEDLVNNAKELKACPYYASRKAAEDAEVIFIPYNTLLHKATREANGIKLKNNIVIVDEAHNLLEALAQMHNVDLNYGQVYHALQQMKSYKNRFHTRFSAKNLLMINQLLFVLGQLFHIMDDNSTCNTTEIFTLENFVLMGNIDNFNMFRLTKFCREARLAQKIRSYAIKYPIEQTEETTIKKGVKEFLASIQNTKSNKNKKEAETPEKNTKKLVIPPVSNPLLTVLSFLETLTYSYKDGRILFKKSTDKLQCKLQFLLLDPSSNFTDIVQEARAVVLAGGTMKPNSEFRDRLFIKAGASPDRIVEFSCDHIVAPENILPIIVTKGQNNGNLLFNFENRMSMGGNIKHIIQQACDMVKGGIVVFFPSYNYENWVWQQIKDTNFGKTVFREPQNSGSVDVVLENYAKAIIKPGSTGALLLSVVGGKLSEGLNFSDDLGRCVIVIGLPYANIMAADLKEKMAYLDKTEGAGSGQKFYENQCMKSVNQCIGRAVRHKNDYATVLLVDERYDRMSIKNMLPNWIKKSLKVGTCDQTFDLVRKFFKNKRTGT